MKPIMRRILADLFLVVLAVCMIIGFTSYFTLFFGPYTQHVEIDLSIWHLPEYTFFFIAWITRLFSVVDFQLVLGFLGSERSRGRKGSHSAFRHFAEHPVFGIFARCRSFARRDF